MANKRFGEDFTEFTDQLEDNDMLLMLSSADNKTYKAKRSKLFGKVKLEYTVFQFAKNASKTVAPKVGWTEAPPITEDNEWLWIRQGNISPLTSSLPVWSAPVRIKGEQGASEVYVGKTPPTDGTFQIAIDPDGDLNGGIPSGGRTGEVLTKTSNNDFATTWNSPLRALFVARGAVYNAATGYYELNGLTDITEEQMINIYNYTNIGLKSSNINDAFSRLPIRTNYPLSGLPAGAYTGISVEARGAFSGNNEIEIVNLSPYITLNNAPYMFYGCPKLKAIIGNIDISNCTSISAMFNRCSALEAVNINKVKLSISFVNSPLLERDSIICLIDNAANTTPIIVTLHSDAKARLTEADITLASSKNITIA